jgi:hypothetical protein
MAAALLTSSTADLSRACQRVVLDKYRLVRHDLRLTTARLSRIARWAERDRVLGAGL